MSDFWDWGVFLREYQSGSTYLSWLMSAWGWTLSVSACALATGLTLGTLAGIARTLPHRAFVRLGDAWCELFRNIPLLVQVFLWYYVVPVVVPPLAAVPGFAMVVLAIGFYTSARVADQVAAGLKALPRFQGFAGLALGLSLAQTYRYVLLPRAFRIIIPPLTSEAMAVIKNSSVAFAVSIPELTMFAMQAQEETSRGIEVYLGVTALYFISALSIGRLTRFVEGRLRIPGTVGGKA